MIRFVPSLFVVSFLGAASAFAPSSIPRGHAFVSSSSGSRLQAATLEEQETKAPAVTSTTTTTATSSPPPDAPFTLWGQPIADIRAMQQEMRAKGLSYEFAPTISAVNDLGLARDDTQGQLKYFQENAMEIKEKMETCGAVIFRDFDLMKTQEGFQAFYNAVGMKVCLDPLHSVSARPTVDGKKDSPVYEAVNKESRKNFFIGMHNEFVGTRAPRAAAFVCFKAAEQGGEFTIADGRRIFMEMDTDLLEELYQRQIRYSVMELPFFGWVEQLPGPFQGPLENVIKTVVSAAMNAKVDFNIELLWQGGVASSKSDNSNANIYDDERKLQARAPRQPPVVVHPVTGVPTWFCNVHSHSSKLRKDREAIYGAERFEDGASRINKSDMFFGDDAELTAEQLKKLDEVTTKNIRYVKMTEGDVVLLDNYMTLHGRNVFDGTRKHGVAWFGGWEGEEEMKQKMFQ